MYVNTKGQGAKENYGIQNIAIDNFKVQKVLYKTHYIRHICLLKNWANYITGFLIEYKP